ncbi:MULTISPECIES: sensor histidine kinase [Actinomadura]|uniref:Sensor-like histidine kinase SenX3 n=1 Tax=Actinomadura yumaensis TaxID=111807 RepID=A0ABW2CKS4_9ACTN|nr:HAMP domain-containing sensor histidine kinase [Actinomadura sp. J1-007]MWK36777.1 sensor histidine kinase [Actinomadura sp. J1-007]
MNRPGARDPERRLVLRARRAVTLQLTGAIALVIALAGGLVYAVTGAGQNEAARRELAAATRGADVGHPPPCVWLSEVRAGAVRRSPGAPAALPAVSVRAADGGARVARARAGGHLYLVRTERRGDATVQAAMDLRYQTAERRRLLRTLVATELAGLLAALLVGRILAQRAIAPLGEALARQRRFVADASHELRTPLARLHTRAELVERRLRRGADPGAVTEEMDRLVAGTRQLGEVVDDLLVSAQLRGPRRTSAVDLAALAEELAAAEHVRARSLGVTIEVTRNGPGVVRGAETALRRVISALLDNALGNTGAGGHIWVTLASGPSRTVELTVSDDGAGLDPRDAERLFARSVGRGHGLGLALAREVVTGHGGTITADGRPGAGAAFTVRIPASPGPARPAARARGYSASPNP